MSESSRLCPLCHEPYYDLPACYAGWRVSTDAERGMLYQRFTIDALQSPDCVSWYWFKHGGDNEPGIVVQKLASSICDTNRANRFLV